MDADERPLLTGRHRPLVERALFGRAITPGRAASIIAGASLLMTVTAGVAARLLDKKDFSSLRDAMWWALQTVTTVGYGDVVPTSSAGRLVAAVLMLAGVSAIPITTSLVVSVFVSRLQREQHAQDAEERKELVARLERIEALLTRESA
jgi:voltage-gated potassium channel